MWALTRAWVAVWAEAEAHARVTVKPGKILRRAVETAQEVTGRTDGGLQPLVSPLLKDHAEPDSRRDNSLTASPHSDICTRTGTART